MPIYEYRCSSCGHELESLRKLSDAPLVACPACKADTLVKLMSAAGFQLKGSGWYATDFKGGGKPAAKTPDGESKTSADASPAVESKTGTEAKPGAETKSTAQTKAEPAPAKSETKAPAAAPASGASS